MATSINYSIPTKYVDDFKPSEDSSLGRDVLETRTTPSSSWSTSKYFVIFAFTCVQFMFVGSVAYLYQIDLKMKGQDNLLRTLAQQEEDLIGLHDVLQQNEMLQSTLANALEENKKFNEEMNSAFNSEFKRVQSLSMQIFQLEAEVEELRTDVEKRNMQVIELQANVTSSKKDMNDIIRASTKEITSQLTELTTTILQKQVVVEDYNLTSTWTGMFSALTGYL